MDSTTQPSQSNKVSFPRILALLLFSFLVAALSVLGTYWYLNSQQTTEEVSQVVPTTAPTAEASPSADNIQSKNNLVLLQANDFSFYAPADWKREKDPPVGINFSDNKGNHINIITDSSSNSEVVGADFVWIGQSNEKGIQISSRSEGCTDYGKETEFKGVKYICDPSTNFTRVIVYQGAGNQHLKAGTHSYLISFGNNKDISKNTDTAIFETILNSFTSK